MLENSIVVIEYAVRTVAFVLRIREEEIEHVGVKSGDGRQGVRYAEVQESESARV